MIEERSLILLKIWAWWLTISEARKILKEKKSLNKYWDLFKQVNSKFYAVRDPGLGLQTCYNFSNIDWDDKSDIINLLNKYYIFSCLSEEQIKNLVSSDKGIFSTYFI